MRPFRITLEPTANGRADLVALYEKLSEYNSELMHYPETDREQLMHNRIRDLLIGHNDTRVNANDRLIHGRGQYHFWISGIWNGLQNERFILIEMPKN